MDLNFNQDQVEIPLSTGKKWAQNYRNEAIELKANDKKTDAYLIPLASLKAVLDQDIDAVRAYKGINDKGEQTLIFVGTKLDNATGVYKDVFKTVSSSAGSMKVLSASAEGDEEVVYDMVQPCPPYGDPDSPMNQ